MVRRRRSDDALAALAAVLCAAVFVVAAKVVAAVIRWAHETFGRACAAPPAPRQRAVAEALFFATLGLGVAAVIMAGRASSLASAHAEETATSRSRERVCRDETAAVRLEADELRNKLAMAAPAHSAARAREERLTRLAAMKADERVREAARACPAEGTCDEEALWDVVDSGRGHAELPVLAANVHRIHTRHLEAVRAAERRQAAKQAAEAAAERRREARAREAERRAEQREEARGLRCCDGTQSPTCLCAGSHRGCCSHHGGVCGCM